MSFAHGMDAQYQRKTLETKVACLGRSINSKYGHQDALLHRRGYAPTGNTASFDDQEKSNSCILISSVLRLATLHVTWLHCEWDHAHDYILRTRRPSLWYVVAVSWPLFQLISFHLISSLLIPHRVRGTPKDIQKCFPPIPVFRRCCCGLPWLPSHPILLSLRFSSRSFVA